MKRRDWLFPLVIFALVAVLLAPSAAVGTGVFGYHDLRHHHLPWRSWAAQRWASGEVPWWASGAGNGFPLLAEGEGGFLYPPTMLLFLLLPDGLALDWSVLGHHIFAAMGMWAYLRALRLRGAAPLVGGLVWAFSGFFVSHALYLGMQNGLAWVGWVLFATVTGRTWLTALGVGMLGLAGHPQAAAFAGLMLGAHALVRLGGRDLLRWALGGAAGVVIAAPQLAASLELSRFSMREGGVGAAFASIGAMPMQELINFVLPKAFGFERPADVTETYFHRAGQYWGSGVDAWETCVYVGVPAAILAAAGLRRSRFWAAVGVVGLVLMLGGPAWALLRHVPGFGFFRFPARFALVVTAAVAVLAAHGVDVLRRHARPGVARRRIVWIAALFSLTTGFANLGLRTRAAEIGGWFDHHFREKLDLPPPPALPSVLAAAALPAPDPEVASAIPAKVRHILADLRESTSPRSSRVLLPLALLLATALFVRRPRMLAALVAADLLAFGHDYHPTVPAAEVDARPPWLAPVMTELGGSRTTVLDRRIPSELDGALLSASLGLPLGTSDVIVPSPLLLVRNDALLASGGLDVGDKGTAKVRRWLDHPEISRRLAVRWIAAVHELPGLIPLVRGAWQVYEDPGALPRARVVACAQRAGDVEEAFRLTLAADPDRSVVLEGDGSRALACVDGGPAHALAAEVVAYRDTEVTLRAEGPGTLVLADTNYPGWTATVDGVPTPIRQADVIYRAVDLGSAGGHTVVFRYDPGLLRWLLGAAIVALLGTIGVPLAAWIGRRRRGAARETA